MEWMRIFLQILLLATFLHFFGMPAIHKYNKKEVMVLETIKDTDGIPLPALSLMFSKEATETHQFKSCYDGLNVSIVDCLKTSTSNVSAILKKTLFGYEKRRTLFLGENNVSESLATSRTGLIFTLNLPLKIGPDDSETQFFLFLSPTFVYVMLHDPNFFILNDNPYGLPTVITVFDAATMYSHYHRIALSEVHELDIPTDPCNDDPSYNFNSCVRSSVTKKVNKMFLPVFGI